MTAPDRMSGNVWKVFVNTVLFLSLNIDKNPLMIKSIISPTCDPNTSLSFLTSVVRMSTEIKMEEAMYSLNNTYQDDNLKMGVKKN